MKITLVFGLLLIFIGVLNAQWQVLNSPTNNRLWSVCFTDTSNGWIVGVNGTIIHTTDAGITWEFQSSGTNNILYSVFFLDNTNGWVVGADGTILHTSNAGINWHNQSVTTNYNLWGVSFVNLDSGWAVSDNGAIIRTTNGGVNWNEQSVNISHGLYDVFFIDEFNGWAIGGTIDFQIIIYTTNGGTNWNVRSNEAGNWLYSVYFVDELNGWISGDNGTILHTTNGGITWLNQISGVDLYLESIFFTDINIGWISGESGTILQTTDGGNTWNIQESNTNRILYNIYFTDSCRGWAVGENGTILKTTNGGWGVTPVELTSFTVKVSINKINLYWSTATELNNKGFEIERSTDKTDWIPIGFKEGNGTTTEPQQYFYSDDISYITNSKLYYGLKQIDFNGSFEYSDFVEVEITPAKFLLEQNYPNPFNPSTKICWQTPVDSWQTLKVYDVLGNEVATLVNEYEVAGSYNVEFRMQNLELSSGIYFYQLKAGDFVETKNMLYLK